MDFDIMTPTTDPDEFVDIDIYIYPDEIRELMAGYTIKTRQNRGEIFIMPPDNTLAEREEHGHYDDVLDALEEMYVFIQQLEAMGPGLLRYTEKEKLKNTYKHYKKQQERYQQTNK